MNTLRSLLNENYNEQMVLINYNIDDYSTSGDYYDSGTSTISLSEEVLLDTINRGNSGSTEVFNWALDHKAMVDVFILIKASNYMQNLALATEKVKITWQTDDNYIHLDKIEITPTGIDPTDDVKIMIFTKLFKIYEISGS
jgi:hypothetical protein